MPERWKGSSFYTSRSRNDIREGNRSKEEFRTRLRVERESVNKKLLELHKVAEAEGDAQFADYLEDNFSEGS